MGCIWSFFFFNGIVTVSFCGIFRVCASSELLKLFYCFNWSEKDTKMGLLGSIIFHCKFMPRERERERESTGHKLMSLDALFEYCIDSSSLVFTINSLPNSNNPPSANISSRSKIQIESKIYDTFLISASSCWYVNALKVLKGINIVFVSLNSLNKEQSLVNFMFLVLTSMSSICVIRIGKLCYIFENENFQSKDSVTRNK